MTDKTRALMEEFAHYEIRDQQAAIVVIINFFQYSTNIYSEKYIYEKSYRLVKDELEKHGLKTVNYRPFGLGATGGKLDLLWLIMHNDELKTLIRSIPLIFNLAKLIKSKYDQQTQKRIRRQLLRLMPEISICLSVTSDKVNAVENVHALSQLIQHLPSVYDGQVKAFAYFRCRVSASIVDEGLNSIMRASFKTAPTGRSSLKLVKRLRRIDTDRYQDINIIV